MFACVIADSDNSFKLSPRDNNRAYHRGCLVSIDFLLVELTIYSKKYIPLESNVMGPDISSDDS